jgi:hypothetical protein
MRTMKACFCVSTIAAAWLLSAGAAVGHPFHVSIAEAEYKPESRLLEVALRVHPSDLEQAVRRLSGKRVVLESDEAAPQIIAWLRRNVVVQTQDGEAAEIRWVGKEVSVKHAWLYFEVPLPGGLEGTEFTNQIFFELLSDQVNTINFREGDQKATLHFTRTRPRRTLTFKSEGEKSAP